MKQKKFWLADEVNHLAGKAKTTRRPDNPDRNCVRLRQSFQTASIPSDVSSFQIDLNAIEESVCVYVDGCAIKNVVVNRL